MPAITERFSPRVVVLEIEHLGELQQVAIVVPSFVCWQELEASVPVPAVPYTGPGKTKNEDDPDYRAELVRAYNRRKALLVAEALHAADLAGGAEGVEPNGLKGRTPEERADEIERIDWGAINAIYNYMWNTLNPEAKAREMTDRAKRFRDVGAPE